MMIGKIPIKKLLLEILILFIINMDTNLLTLILILQ